MEHLTWADRAYGSSRAAPPASLPQLQQGFLQQGFLVDVVMCVHKQAERLADDAEREPKHDVAGLVALQAFVDVLHRGKKGRHSRDVMMGCLSPPCCCRRHAAQCCSLLACWRGLCTQ